MTDYNAWLMASISSCHQHHNKTVRLKPYHCQSSLPHSTHTKSNCAREIILRADGINSNLKPGSANKLKPRARSVNKLQPRARSANKLQPRARSANKVS